MNKKRIWDNRELIGEVEKSKSTKLVIELVAREGVKYINIREWYIKKSEGVWKPGMAGFAVPVAIPIDGEVVAPALDLSDLLQEALDKAPKFELEDEENAVWAETKR